MVVEGLCSALYALLHVITLVPRVVSFMPRMVVPLVSLIFHVVYLQERICRLLVDADAPV